MLLFDGHVLTRLRFPVLGKGGVELGVELTGGVVRHVEQGDGRGLRGGQTARTQQSSEAEFDRHRSHGLPVMGLCRCERDSKQSKNHCDP